MLLAGLGYDLLWRSPGRSHGVLSTTAEASCAVDRARRPDRAVPHAERIVVVAVKAALRIGTGSGCCTGRSRSRARGGSTRPTTRGWRLGTAQPEGYGAVVLVNFAAMAYRRR
jgi:hypothetical protein